MNYVICEELLNAKLLRLKANQRELEDEKRWFITFERKNL